MILSPHIKKSISVSHIELDDTIVPSSTVAMDIGVFFDAYFHFHSIGNIQKLLDHTEMMVRSDVIYRLDNTNWQKRQRVQDAAALS